MDSAKPASIGNLPPIAALSFKTSSGVFEPAPFGNACAFGADFALDLVNVLAAARPLAF
jgi:hypothetical protein